MNHDFEIPFSAFSINAFVVSFSSSINGNEYVLADSNSNDVRINTDSKYKNDCDEYNTGTNDAICATKISQPLMALILLERITR